MDVPVKFADVKHLYEMAGIIYLLQTNGSTIKKPVLIPVIKMKKEHAAWCLQQTFFPHCTYAIQDFKSELVGQSNNSMRISIDNDFYTVSLTIGGNGSIWSTDTPAQNVKIPSCIHPQLYSWGYDLFSLHKNGECWYQDINGKVY